MALVNELMAMGLPALVANRVANEYTQSTVRAPFGGLRRTLISNRTHMTTGLSNGTDTGATFRTVYTNQTGAAVHDPELVYCNVQMTVPGAGLVAEADGPNSVTFKASVEYPAGTFRPVFFNGKREMVLEPGATVMSDPIGLTLPAGATYYVRTFVTVTSGEKWPTGSQGIPELGDKSNRSTNPVDMTLTDTGTFNTSNHAQWAPVAIVGKSTANKPTWAVIGDSIAQGSGDALTPPGDAYGNLGWCARLVGGRYGCPYTKLARSGDKVSEFLKDYSRRLAILSRANVSHVLVEGGLNDALSSGATSAAVIANLQTLWGLLADRGYVVYQATLLPGGTGTDWAAYGTQIPHSLSASVRAPVNEYIRTVPAPLTGIIDAARVVEVGTSGRWKTDGTANKWTVDGTHPSAYGHEQIAALAHVSKPIKL